MPVQNVIQILESIITWCQMWFGLVHGIAIEGLNANLRNSSAFKKHSRRLPVSVVVILSKVSDCLGKGVEG